MKSFQDVTQLIPAPIELIVFERGLVLRPVDGRWATHSGAKSGAIFVNPDEVQRQFRPLFIKYQSLQIIALINQHGAINPYINIPSLYNEHFYNAFAIQYLSQALIYHLDALQRQYEVVRDDMKDSSLIPGAETSTEVSYQGRAEPYFEFDALLTVARRTYDSCRYLLWKKFGTSTRAIHMPRTFEKVISSCEKLDVNIRKDLQESWDTWGKPLTDYRDCMMHYVPIDFGMSNILLHQDLPGVWTAKALIPDNPNERAKARFTFRKKVDALTFGWSLTNEIVRVLRLVVSSVS